MKAWTELYKEHQAIRRSAGKSWSTDVRNRLNKLMHHCGATTPRPFTKKANGRLEEWFIPGGALELTNLEGGGSAKLDVLVRSDGGTGHIHEMNVFVEGIRDDDSRWVIAVHLPDDRRQPGGDKQGFGACSHAALHCHVGPTLDDEPKVRVPMPALPLPEVLDWLIAQVTQSETFEPALWADPRVAAACKPDAKSR